MCGGVVVVVVDADVVVDGVVLVMCVFLLVWVGVALFCVRTLSMGDHVSNTPPNRTCSNAQRHRTWIATDTAERVAVMRCGMRC